MQKTFGDLMRLALIGKKLKHRNQYGRTVTLEVEDVHTEHRSVRWWGERKDWDETMVYFVDGSSIEITASTKLDIIEKGDSDSKPEVLKD